MQYTWHCMKCWQNLWYWTDEIALAAISRWKVRYMLKNNFIFLLQVWLLRLACHLFVVLKHSSVDKWCHWMPILNFVHFFTYQLDFQRRRHQQKNMFLFSHPKSKHNAPDNKEILLFLWCTFFCFSENQWSSGTDILVIHADSWSSHGIQSIYVTLTSRPLCK